MRNIFSVPYHSVRFWVILGIITGLGLVMTLALVTCNQSNNITLVEETQEKHYQRGLRLLKEGREQEALSAFLKVIEKRHDAPEANLEVGRLYLNYIEDPIAAIYHFRKYLEYCPNSEQAPAVRQLIDTARKQFARSLPGQPYQDEMERIDLLKILEQTREENAKLKKKLAIAKERFEEAKTILGPQSAAKLARLLGQQGLEGSSVSNNSTINKIEMHPVVTRPPVSAQNTSSLNSTTSKVSTYTVEPGDTLSKISQKVYGSSTRWKEILAANPDILPNPNSLKPGQVLKIP